MFRRLISSITIFSFVIVSGVLSTVVVDTAKADSQLRRVPSQQYPDIQSAINASSDGDSVRVSNGTYTENIDFLGLAITVFSENGAGSTTIDGGQLGSVVTFQTEEDGFSQLIGFTITNGSATLGGGIACFKGQGQTTGASPTIKDCIIDDNSATTGGGIGCDDESCPLIDDNTIVNNSATYGGGIACLGGSDATITANLIGANNNGNSATDDGGGIYCENSMPEIKDKNSISYNTATDCGGGIAFERSGPVGMGVSLVDNTISNNTAEDSGGGVYCHSTNEYSEIELNVIKDNKADWDGGGIMLGEINGEYNSNPLLTEHMFIHKNRIFDNEADYSGGGVASWSSRDIWMEDNIIRSNTAEVEGGGIVVGNTGGTTRILNNLIRSNTVTGTEDWHGGGGICVEADSYVIIASCTIGGNSVNEDGDGKGGGLYVADDEDTTVEVVNGILWNDSAPTAGTSEISDEADVTDVTYTDVKGGWPGDGNKNVAPDFEGGQEWYYYRLASTSTLIDVGYNDATLKAEEDFEGDDREIDGAPPYQGAVIDMGWDEYKPPTP